MRKKENALLEIICQIHARVHYITEHGPDLKWLKVELDNIMSKYRIKKFNAPDDRILYDSDAYDLVGEVQAEFVDVVIPAYYRLIDNRRALIRKGVAKTHE